MRAVVRRGIAGRVVNALNEAVELIWQRKSSTSRRHHHIPNNLHGRDWGSQRVLEQALAQEF